MTSPMGIKSPVQSFSAILLRSIIGLIPGKNQKINKTANAPRISFSQVAILMDFGRLRNHLIHRLIDEGGIVMMTFTIVL